MMKRACEPPAAPAADCCWRFASMNQATAPSAATRERHRGHGDQPAAPHRLGQRQGARLAGDVRAFAGGGEESGQRHLERAGALEALLRVGRQRPLHDLDERAGQIRSLVAQAAHFTRGVHAPHFLERTRGDRHLARHQAIEQHADAVDVGAGRGFAAGEQLRRHVERRAREIGNRRLAGQSLLASGAEVHQHDAAVAVAHHVVGFDVAMQQAGAVHRGERFADVEADQRGFARAEAAALLENLFERLPLDQLHPQPDHAFGARGAVDRHHVGMIDLGQQPRLVNHRVGVAAADRLGDQLERDFAVEARIPGAIDGAVGAAADHLA